MKPELLVGIGAIIGGISGAILYAIHPLASIGVLSYLVWGSYLATHERLKTLEHKRK